ncbi:MAG: phosphatidate cytidylyltransferase [Actinomycetota bacterium]
MPTEPAPRFTRPWEEPLEASVDPEDEPREAANAPSALDGKLAQPTIADLIAGDDDGGEASISEEAYLSATTAEYRDLAEEIAQGGQEPNTRPAVAASMAGLGSGLVDFADVTGRPGIQEEDVEHVEQAAASDLTLRIISALVLVGLFMATLLMGGWFFTGFVGAVMVIAVGELYATLRRHGFVPIALFGLLGTAGAAVAMHLGGPGPLMFVTLLSAMAVVLFFSVVPRRRPLDNATVTIFGAAWVSLLAFAVGIGASPNALPLVLLLVVLVALFDIGSYFAGKAMGRHPMAPELSPKKTWEGYVGGIVLSGAAATFLSTVDWFLIDLSQSVVLTVIVAVFSPIGDAAESLVKRSLGVKDMGSVLPGHGGMLDRIDGLLFVAPAAYLFMRSAGLL